MYRYISLLPAILLVIILSQPLTYAQEPASDSLLTVAHFLDMERVSSPQISPDGSQIIYTRRYVNKMEDRWDAELWIMKADGTKHRFLTKGSNPQWSPDGTRIVYLARGDTDSPQLFVRWMDAEGASSQITRVTQTPASYEWSPDSRSVAFVMLVPQPEKWSIDMPAPPEGATWTAPPRVVSSTHFRQDRQGFHKEGFTHLFVVPADGGTPRQLTEGDWNVGARFSGIQFGAGIDWTPDGTHLIFDGLMEETEKDGYKRADLYAVNVATGEVRTLTSQPGYWSGPVVSPDGRQVAFRGYRYSPHTYHTSELYTVGLDGQNMRKISGDFDRDVSSLHWAADSKGVYFTSGDRGTQNVHFASLGGNVRTVTEGTHMLTLNSMTPGGMAVGTRTDFYNPGDVVRFDLSSRSPAIQQLTNVNADVLEDKKLGDVEEVWYTSTDDTQVQGWIVKPPDFDADEDYPLILHIHGGPHAMYNVGFSYSYQNYAANGFVVLYTNPRGSTGYGTDFGNAIDNGYPSVDHDDLMAGVDATIDKGYIDEERLYITGCSGGGVLSSWAIGQTDRFAAAAVRCPVTNWISFAGTADIVQWGYERFDGYFWDDPTKWLEHSPLMHVGKVKTPVLLMTGELDLRTPMSQTEEYYAALKVLGVPAKLLRFNEEYHGTGSKPSNFMRTQLYIMDWFNRYPEAMDEVSQKE